MALATAARAPSSPPWIYALCVVPLRAARLSLLAVAGPDRTIESAGDRQIARFSESTSATSVRAAHIEPDLPSCHDRSLRGHADAPALRGYGRLQPQIRCLWPAAVQRQTFGRALDQSPAALPAELAQASISTLSLGAASPATKRSVIHGAWSPSCWPRIAARRSWSIGSVR